MTKRETINTGGALSVREMMVTLVDDEAGFVDMLLRLRSKQPLAAQIVAYFDDLKEQLAALPGVKISRNFVLTTPWGVKDRNAHALMAAEFGELRDALFQIVLDDHDRWVPRLAPEAQLTAVARAHFAGQLAKTRQILPREPATETGIRVDEHLAGNRGKAAKAKGVAATIWQDKAVEIARSKLVSTRKYSAKGCAAEVLDELAKWLPGEYERLGREYDGTKHLPEIDTVRKAIPASKIFGKTA